MSAPDDHFSPIATNYAAGRFGYPRELFARLAAVAPGRGHAWDCATGSGQAALGRADFFQYVTATDLSAELLALAPPHPRVNYRAAPAEAGGLAPVSVDLVTVAQALHWFDLPRFFAEADRVLAPGGVLAVWGYVWPEVDAAVDALLEELRPTLAPHWPARSALLHERYASVRLPWTELAGPDFAVRVDWTADDYLNHLRSWSAVRYHREHRGDDVLATFSPRLHAAWGAARRAVRWPLILRVCRKPAG